MCDPNQICHVYCTLTHEPYNSVFLNIHTGKDLFLSDL